MPHLRDGIEDDLATVILNNPPQHRLSVEMLDELAQGLDMIGQSAARALLLRADGPDFSFGGDIGPWPEASTAQRRALFERYMSVFNLFERLPIPTIAAVGNQGVKRRKAATGHRLQGPVPRTSLVIAPA